MKAAALYTTKRFDTFYAALYNIESYGERNDYPDTVMEAVGGSPTGSGCVKRYFDFIYGKGFADNDIFSYIVNRDGETADSLLHKVVYDYAMFGGFGLHLNYNANGQITSVSYVPFEMIRFDKPDKDAPITKVAIHPDWGHRRLDLDRWRRSDIVRIDLYDPDPAKIAAQAAAAGGWNKYRGQVFYYSNKGRKNYPLPIFDSVLTDMNTEEGISNVTNRNAKNNFLPSGIVVEVLKDTQASNVDTELAKALTNVQGDTNACKLIYAAVESKDDMPVVLPFEGKNFDKDFEVSRNSVQDSIGKCFSQPPILRGVDVGGNFGAQLVRQAYDYYNSITTNERQVLERVFVELFKHWHEPITPNFEIEPLSYDVEMSLADELGDRLGAFMDMIKDTSLTAAQRRTVAHLVYGVDEETAQRLIPETI